MRTEVFSSALLSTLIVISLMAPVLTLLFVSSATPTSAQTNYTIIVRGKENAHTVDNQDPEPAWRPYGEGELPPIMAVKAIDPGRVAAASIAATCRDNYWNYTENPDPHLDVLLDKTFQWMKSGATKVLWYEGYNVYNTTARCRALIDALKAKGYTIGTDNRAFSAIENLAAYDILVIPQLQLGTSGTGGSPGMLPDSEVSVIKSFVENAASPKGLLVLEASDYAGHNYYKVQNKILKAFEMGMYFQSDQVNDNVNYFGPRTFPYSWRITVDVDVTTDIGAGYLAVTGKTRIGLPSVGSLAEVPTRKVVVSISPGYRMGLAGGTLFYTVTVKNMGALDDTYDLTVSDNADWGPTLDKYSLTVPGFFEENSAVLSVTIPSGASRGDSDNIRVVAISRGDSAIRDNKWCLAISDTRIKPTTADAQVVEGAGFENRNYGKDTYAYVGSSKTAYMDERVFLRFDLRAMGTATVENVRLYVYNFRLSGAPDKNIALRKVDNDDWDELIIKWTDQPGVGDLIGKASMPDEDLWYSWDVKDYVLAENARDNMASFCMMAETENLAFPDNFSYGFSTKEYAVSGQHPYLVFGPRVWTRITQRYQVGMPGGTLSYKVLIQNVGAVHDTYNLRVVDNASPSWGPTISPTTLTLEPGAFGFATVTVTIPPGAPMGENIDNITVVATSTVDPTISDNYWCTVSVSDNIIKPPSDDSTVKEKEPVSNVIWGTDDTIYVGRYLGGPERGFLKFDLSAIPSGTSIARARLWLNAFRVDNVERVVPVIQVRSVGDDAWVERGAGRLMWGNQPSIGSVLDVRAVIENGRYCWDVTSFVQSQFAGDKVASFALVDLSENIAPDHRARFTSKEYGVRENHPYLEILTAEPSREVRVYISPVFQGGLPGATLSYVVTVKNTGTTSDTYTLTVENVFPSSISPTSLTLGPGASGTATLSVTIPSGPVCTLDRIRVTASSTSDPGVKDSAACFAHLSKATFKLENLTKISIDMNLRLRDDAAKLVARFYAYDDAFQGENVVWSTMPWHMENKPYIIHPLNNIDYPVQKVKLLLVDAGGTEIQMVKDFMVRRAELGARVGEIRLAWRGATLSERSLWGAEVGKIRLIWRGTPA